MFFFFFNDTATTEIYTLSLHDALPIYSAAPDGTISAKTWSSWVDCRRRDCCGSGPPSRQRSEEHTSELQSRPHLVCRLLLEKKHPPVAQDQPVSHLQLLGSELPHAHGQ